MSASSFEAISTSNVIYFNAHNFTFESTSFYFNLFITLFDWLKQQPKPAVNLSKCVHLHAAVLQVLLMVRPKVVGAINDPLLSQALAQTQA